MAGREYVGIVLRQVQALNGTRMITMLTEDGGKISAGTKISEGSKKASALAIRPFALSRFMITERGGFLNIGSSEALDAHYGIGENVDRYMDASFVLEFTDKLLPEGLCDTEVFTLLKSYLEIAERRKRDFRLLTISYMVQLFMLEGIFPEPENFSDDELLKDLDFDIFKVIIFLMENSLEKLEKLSLDDKKSGKVFRLLRKYANVHLDIGPLKSDVLMQI
ncbi:MAG: DNA repair protein RecO [Clostridiales Family XIII bacterium]|jgi:DNA repair protein RecO (recombination protein O)|nr:DNA repair protein RecO [Clostridiales Family XIII bacterium]